MPAAGTLLHTCWDGLVAGASARMTTSPPAQIPAASSPDPACRRARASQGQALRVAAKTRPALTGPARGGCAFWRSGRKNARGAGRTKEWTPTWIISKEIADLCRAPAASSCSVSILDAVHMLTFYRVCAKRGSLLANVVGIVVHDHWKP